MVVGQRLIASNVVVEAKAEDIDFTALARVDREFAIEVEEVEWQVPRDVGV